MFLGNSCCAWLKRTNEMTEQHLKKMVGILLIVISLALYFLGAARQADSSIRFFCFALGIWGIILFATAKTKP